MQPTKPDSAETFTKISRNLGETTCMHGVPNIARARSPLRRLLWVFVTLGGLGGLAWQTSVLVQKFNSYPVDTTLSILYDTSLDYPMISICNMNPLRMSSLADAPRDLQKIYGYYNGSMLDLDGDDDDDDDEETDEEARKTGGWSRNVNKTDYFTSHSDKHTQKLQQLYQMRNLSAEQQQKLGHNLTWMLLGCEYNGYICSPDNFTHFFNPYYGNCYAFNSGVSDSIRKTSRPGPLFGLILELFVEHDEYITDHSGAAGIKVVIGNQTEMPYPEDEGISAAVGTQTSISLSRMDIKRARPPHGSCHNYSGRAGRIRNLYWDQNPLKIKYSDRACFKTCYQKQVIKTCGCCDAVHPCSGYAISAVFDFVPKVCNVSDEATVIRLYEDGLLVCRETCPPACSEVTYKAEVSSAHWPTKRMVMSVGGRLADKVRKESELNEALVEHELDDVNEFLRFQSRMTYRVLVKLWHGNDRENVLKLEIFYRKLNYESVITSPSFEEGDLLSNFGGQLGLWVGISVVTVFEFIEYGFNLLVLVGSKLYIRYMNKVKPSSM